MIERCDQSFEYGNLHIHLPSLTDIFVAKSITEREGDLEDAALIAKQADLDWESIFQEIDTQEDRTSQFLLFAVLDTLDTHDERHNIVFPITDRLVSYCLENTLLVSLDAPKIIEDLREELEFPDHQIYNKLRKHVDGGCSPGCGWPLCPLAYPPWVRGEPSLLL